MGPPTEATQHETVQTLLCPSSGDWDREKIKQLLPEHEKTILEIRPSKLGAQDRYIWLLTKTGEYSAKSGYHATSIEDLPLAPGPGNVQAFD